MTDLSPAEALERAVSKLRLGRQRRHIFLCVAGEKCAPVARSEESWDYLKRRFRELGLVSAAEIGGAAVYEISAAAHPAHNHLVCRDCGDIDHVPADLFDDFAARLRDRFGFRADMDSLTISGLCRECDPVDGP